MSFYIVSLAFVRPATILVDDQIRTMQFEGKTLVMLVVGEQEINGKPHMCGFVSRIANNEVLPTHVLDQIKEQYDELLKCDVPDRIAKIKGIYDSNSIKIQKDKIVDRTVGDGPEPIHMYGRNKKPLWR